MNKNVCIISDCNEPTFKIWKWRGERIPKCKQHSEDQQQVINEGEKEMTKKCCEHPLQDHINADQTSGIKRCIFCNCKIILMEDSLYREV